MDVVDALANWVWQGGAVALAATIILGASRRMSATTRYNLWWTTLAVVLALPALAWLLTSVLEPDGGSADTLAAAPAAVGMAAVSVAPARVILPVTPAWVVSAIGLIWLLWVTISLARIGSAYIGLRRMRAATRDFPEDRERRLPTWVSVRGRGQPVKLAVSDDVRAAAVIGFVSPTIAVAPRTLDALTDAELDQIVVHEWAHVQRGDAAARLIQRIVAAAVGLHPAIWWIDRQLNLERETACDDWAIRAAGTGRSLAACLTKLAGLSGRDTGAALSPAALATSELSIRVTRLLDGRRNTSTRPTFGVPMLVTAMLAALAVTVASMELVMTAPLQRAIGEPAAYAEPGAERRPAAAQPETRREPAAIAGRSHRRGERRLTTTAPTSAPPSLGDQAARSARPSPSRLRDGDLPAGVWSLPYSVAEAPFEPEKLPGASTGVSSSIAAPLTPVTPDAQPVAVATKPTTPWGAAANAGVTVGKGSQKAAVATAGFFTRLSKSISGAF